jgi:hypothetical protein
MPKKSSLNKKENNNVIKYCILVQISIVKEKCKVLDNCFAFLLKKNYSETKMYFFK